MNPRVAVSLAFAGREARGARGCWWEARRAIDPPADSERGVGR